MYTGFIYRVICGTCSVRRSDKVINNQLYNVLLLLDYLLNTVLNSLQRLDSSNFHRIQMHQNRPILYIALIIKSKTLIILKSKKGLSLQFCTG